MKKIVGLSLALIMIVGMIGVATLAYFTDNETSSGNQLVAGTLDLKTTNDTDGVSQTLYATNMSPGATVVSTITLKNDGTTNGTTLDIVFSYEESDDIPNNIVNKTADEVAALIEVITLNYGGSSLLDRISDENSNGYQDVYDLKSSDLNLPVLSGIDASDTKNFDISVQLRSETGNDFQADGITITMTFTLKQ